MPIPQSDLVLTIVVSIDGHSMTTVRQSTTYDDRSVKTASWNAPLVNKLRKVTSRCTHSGCTADSYEQADVLTPIYVNAKGKENQNKNPDTDITVGKCVESVVKIRYFLIEISKYNNKKSVNLNNEINI